jgi:Putative mono-oxygenase ydhR
VYIRIVTFRLQDMTADQYEHHAVHIAGAFTAWPGLRAKFWLADRPQRVFGGVYLFDSAGAAERSRSTPLFAGMADNPAFADLSVREFDTLAAPTSITAGEFPTAA